MNATPYFLYVRNEIGCSSFTTALCYITEIVSLSYLNLVSWSTSMLESYRNSCISSLRVLHFSRVLHFCLLLDSEMFNVISILKVILKV